MCLDFGIGGLFALYNSGNLDQHLASLPEVNGIDPSSKKNDIGSLVNQYVVAGEASTEQKQLLAALVERVSNKDITVLQVSHNDSATDPRKDRWNLSISGPSEFNTPSTYVRAETKVGMEFVDSMKTILNDNNSEAYALGWKKLTLLIATLMGSHVDQSTSDVDSEGMPYKHATRTVISSGMPSKISFTLKAIKVEAKTSSSSNDDNDDDELEDIEAPENESASAVSNVRTSKSRKNSTTKYRTRQLGKYTMYIDAGIHSYTLGPKGAGRHILGKVNIEGEWWAVVLFHSPEANTDITSSLRTRIALITTTFHDSEEQLEDQMTDIRKGTHLIPQLAVTALNVNPVIPSTDEIDLQLRAVVPYDPNKDEKELTCLLCDGEATFVDMRNLRNQPERSTNNNGAEIGVGCIATVHYDEESSEDPDPTAPSEHTTQYCGVISHVNITSSAATVHFGDGSTDNVSIDLLHRAKDENPDPYDPSAVEQNLRCTSCVHEDPVLYNPQLDEFTPGLIVQIEKMCKSCMREEKLKDLRACASCLGGKTKCIGWNEKLDDGETKRTFTCTGASEGVILTNDNISGRGRLCNVCIKSRQSHNQPLQNSNFYRSCSFEEVWREFWCATTNQREKYTKPWRQQTVPNWSAIFGNDDGILRLETVWSAFSEEYDELCAKLGDDNKAMKKIISNVSGGHYWQMKKKTITIERENKCVACRQGELCQWVDEENPKQIDSLASFDAYVHHGGKFGKEAHSAAAYKSGKKRKGEKRKKKA